MRLLPKFVLAVLAPVLVGGAGALLVLSFRLQTEREGVRVQAESQLRQRAGDLAAQVRARRDALQLLAATPALQSGDVKDPDAALRVWSGQGGLFDAIVYQPFGVPARTDRGPAALTIDAATWAALDAGRGDRLVRPVGSAGGGTVDGPVADISPQRLQLLVPVRNAQGRLAGALAGSVPLAAVVVPLALQPAAPQPAAPGVRWLLLDGQSRLLAEPPSGPVAAGAPDVASAAALATALAAALASAPLPPPAVTLPFEGPARALQAQDLRAGEQRYKLLYAPVPGTDWRLVRAQTEAAVRAPLLAPVLRVAALLGVVLVLALLGAWWVQRQVARPLVRLVDAHARVRAGDLSVRAPEHGHGELADLERSFNRMAESLSAAEDKFRRVFEAFPHPVSLHRLSDGCYVDINPAFAAKTGRSRADVIGRTGLDFGLVRSDDLKALKVAELLSAGRLDDVTLPVTTADGLVLWVLYSSRLIELDGQPVALTVATDITPIKQAEERLRQSEQNFTALFESAPLPMNYSRRDGGHTTSIWNQAWYRAFGYSREQAEGRPGTAFGMWVDPAERARYGEQVRAGNGRTEGYAAQLRHQDGSVHWYEVSGQVIETSAGATLMSVYVDVTQVRRAALAAQAAQARLQAVFDASPVAMVVSDVARDYQAVAANKAWYRQFQREPSQVLGRNGQQMGLWVDTAARARLLAQLQREGDEISGFETELVRGDGSRLLGRMAARRFKAGDDELMVMVQEDITDSVRAAQALNDSREQLRELNETLEERVVARTQELRDALQGLRRAQAELVRAEKLASLGSLVAGVAHELNTPIGNAVMVASTVADQQREFEAAIAGGLRKSTLDNYLGNAREASLVLERNLQRAAELVGSFKQLAVDQSSYQRRRFALAEVLQEVLLALSPTLRRSAVTLQHQVPDGLLLDSYPGPLGQVLVNLISNALVHAFEPGAAGLITISAGPAGEPGRLCLRLADNGRGIAEADLGRIFDPFFTTRLGQGGSGLGLHIVYNLVTELLGGRIEVHSTVGSGTEFVIDLPLRAPEG